MHLNRNKCIAQESLEPSRTKLIAASFEYSDGYQDHAGCGELKMKWMLFLVVFLQLIAVPAWPHSRGMYASKDEAQKRAEELGCQEVHRKGDRWTPCRDEQALHRALRAQ